MATQDTPPKRSNSRYANRPAPSGGNYRRLVFRLFGLPILAAAAWYFFYGVQEYFVLPKCDSEHAKQSLSKVLKDLKLEPTSYEPITTVSSSKDEVVCHAVLPLPKGGDVVADFTFYWQGKNVNMSYNITPRASRGSGIGPPHPAALPAAYGLAGTR